MRFLHAFLVVALLAGCAAAPIRLSPLPEKFADIAAIPGVPGARHWGDSAPPTIEEWGSLDRAALAKRVPGIMDRPHHYLALSGGGPNGAFGAGVLVGWTVHGTRPEFTMVTGVSTGALIAPFAFLGPKYDATLRKLYTEMSTSDILERRSLLDIVRNDSIASSAPLLRLIARYVDDQVIAELAEQHRRGRKLVIGTTNLDADRPVSWNLTRIAASGSPQAKALIHRVLLASASIPGVFPPVMFEVDADGRRFDEMHVDGGVTAQVIVYPGGLDWREVGRALNVIGKPKLYLINNSHTTGIWQEMDQRIVPILLRTIDALIRTQGNGDIAQIFLLSQRDGIDFNLAYIPRTFTEQPNEQFDPVYMRKLFELGFEMAKQGYPWVTQWQKR
jgi:Patatin-like phospholipase